LSIHQVTAFFARNSNPSSASRSARVVVNPVPRPAQYCNIVLD
jgi:hypothetical protein